MTKATGGDVPKAELKPDTKLTTGGRNPHAHHGYVNTPVYHASTLLYRTAEDFLARRGQYFYGRRGTPTSEALGTAIQEIEGPACAGVALLPSGLAAISTALLSVLQVRRPRVGDRQLLRPDPQVLRQRAQPLRRHDDLLRSVDRRRHRRADAAEHPCGVHRGARLAVVRDAGHSGDRRRRSRARRAGADGQHLGEPALFPRAGEGRRSFDPVRAPNTSAAIPT